MKSGGSVPNNVFFGFNVSVSCYSHSNNLIFKYNFGVWTAALDFSNLDVVVQVHPLEFSWLIRCGILVMGFGRGKVREWSEFWSLKDIFFCVSLFSKFQSTVSNNFDILEGFLSPAQNIGYQLIFLQKIKTLSPTWKGCCSHLSFYCAFAFRHHYSNEIGRASLE